MTGTNAPLLRLPLKADGLYLYDADGLVVASCPRSQDAHALAAALSETAAWETCPRCGAATLLKHPEAPSPNRGAEQCIYPACFCAMPNSCPRERNGSPK